MLKFIAIVRHLIIAAGKPGEKQLAQGYFYLIKCGARARKKKFLDTPDLDTKSSEYDGCETAGRSHTLLL